MTWIEEALNLLMLLIAFVALYYAADDWRGDRKGKKE